MRHRLLGAVTPRQTPKAAIWSSCDGHTNKEVPSMNPSSETELRARMQRIQDNLQMMHTYFDALFGKDLTPILEMID
jgi:hypothetical protein